MHMRYVSGNLLSGVVRGKLRRLGVALRLRLAAEGAAWLVLSAFAAMLVTLAVDYTLRLERAPRAVVVGVAAAALLAVAWRRLMRPLLVPMDLRALALLVERRRPQLADRLISAIELSRLPPGASAAMVQRLAREADEMARGLDLRGIVERRRMFQVAASACCAVALVAGLGLWQSDLMARYLRRNLLLKDVLWPQKTYLRVAGEDFTVVRGDDLRVVVSLEPRSREAPPHVTVHARYPSVGWTEQRVDAAGDGAGEYVKLFRRVTEPFEFYVTGGDDRRDRRSPHRVRLVPPATLEELSLIVDYPAYTQRASRSFAGGQGILVLPAGSSIRLDGRCGKDLRSALLHVDGETPSRVQLSVREVGDGQGPPRRRRVVGRVHVPPGAGARTMTLRFELTDTDGFVSRRGQQIVCQVEPDAAPNVSLTCPALGRSVTPQAVLPLHAEMEDDYGVSRATALVRRAGAEEPVTREPLELPDGAGARVRGEHELDLRPLKLGVGDALRVRVEAADTLPAEGGYGGPNVGTSPPLEFDVVSPEDLLGELVRRQKELRLEFVQAIAAQASAEAKSASAAELAETGAVTPEVRRRLNASAHLQQSVGTECAKAAETLAGLLAQMEWNRLGSPADRGQLRTDVIAPLEQLAEPIERTGAALSAAAERTDAGEVAADARRVGADQRDIRLRMERIAERMQKLETRQDLARQLRLIIRMSEQLRDRIRKRQEEGVIEIFETPEEEQEE
jgi:hypothetical protein